MRPAALHWWGTTAATGCILALIVALAGCELPAQLRLTPLSQPTAVEAAQARVNGTVAGDRTQAREFIAPAAASAPRSAPSSNPGIDTKNGDITLNFVDTDIREVVRTILGTALGLTYTIDPNVRGSASFETATPLPRSALRSILETLLNQNGATLVERDGIYSVMPMAGGQLIRTAATATSPGAATQVIPLHFASAKDLGKLLEPYVAEGGKITADTTRNALVVSGDPTVRQTLVNLIDAFDIDTLAGQSYALFPVGNGDLHALVGELEKVLQADAEGPLANLVRVVPMERVNAVLVVSSQARYVDDARRFFHLTNRVEDATARTWHVYYVQNGQSADLEPLLQRAFTPGHLNPTPPPGSTAPGAGRQTINSPSATGATSTVGGLASGLSAGGGGGAPGGGLGSGLAAAGAGGARAAAENPAASALSGGGEDDKGESRVRILANRTNNALLIFATPSEYGVIEGMLRKIDIIPLQVLIEATIAEVTLNDALQYGTQFYLRENSWTQALSGGAASKAFANNFPGFVLTRGAGLAINALSQVSTVRVLSSPQVMVLDNQAARLQVGSLVPVLTGSAQSTLTSGAPIVNNIAYQETGVIMQVTPHVNSGGLVTLDIGQEVSDVAAQTTTAGIDSPTFNERVITTRVAIQDGQTIGMAGLIQDNDQQGNTGIPFLKDIPVLSFFAGAQNNSRARTELLVLLTPHVVRDQRDARALTEDLRNQLNDAAIMPQYLKNRPLSGSPNPAERVR